MVKLFSRLGKTVTKGLQDVGGASPPLASYRFVSVSGSKTATVLLYDTDGNVMAQETLTVTTTPLQATDNSLWAGDWDPAYAGMQVLSADVGIYALPTNGSPEVTTSNGRQLGAGLCLGAMPGQQAHSVPTGLEVPQNVAMIRGGASDATIQVEFWDMYGKTVAVDGGASKQLTISSTAKSLDKFLIDASVTGGVPDGAVGGRILVLTNSICVNTGGSDDGTGTNGLAAAAVAPTANSPRRYVAGDAFEFGRS